MIKKILLVVTLAFLTFCFIGCQTIKGIGRDISSIGAAGEKVLEKP